MASVARLWPALLLAALAGPLAAAPRPAWVIEGGGFDPAPDAPVDTGCDEPDSGDRRLFDCGATGPVDSESATGWALGFDYPLVAVGEAGGGWYTGFRIGRLGKHRVSGRWAESGDSAVTDFTTVVRSDYALATLDRAYAMGYGWQLRLGGGAGIARTRTADSLRQTRGGSDPDATLEPPDGATSGYMLRASLELAYRMSGGTTVGLGIRRDWLDGYATGDGEGRVQSGGTTEAVALEASRGDQSIQSVILSLRLPLGGPDNQTGGR